MIVVRALGREVELDPLLLGPMSVRELAAAGADRLGYVVDHRYSLVGPDGAVLDPEAVAPSRGAYELVDLG